MGAHCIGLKQCRQSDIYLKGRKTLGTRIVLVRPTHSGNIGAAARAMATMGMGELVLVQPHAPIDDQARALAANALDILTTASSVEQLDDAIADCKLVCGTSARARRIDWPTIAPRRCGSLVVEATQRGHVAILFGPERTGLTNAEMDRCQHLVRIPTASTYSSLNVASAVQILTYEIWMAMSGSEGKLDADDQAEAVDQEQMHRFYDHLEQLLVAVEFLDPDNPRLLMRRLRRLFNRAQPDQNEMNILRGILTETLKRLGALDKPDRRGA